MINIEHCLKGYPIEIFGYSGLDHFLSKFETDKKFILFFDLANNKEVNDYVSANYNELVESFNNLGRTFVYLPKMDFPDNATDVFKYYIPHLKPDLLGKLDLSMDMLFMSLTEVEEGNLVYDGMYKDTLKALNYYGNIQSGFLFFDNNKGVVVRYNDEDIEKDNASFFRKILQFFADNKEYEDSNIFSSRRGGFEDFHQILKDNLDNDAQEKITLIEKQLEELKSSGCILFAMPILKNILEEYSQQIDLRSVSKIHITEDYRIVLPYFDNLEIELSHLTKSMYILFYQNPSGINIGELWRYETQLKNIYFNISNQVDYDSMMQSIKEFVQPGSKAIYTHISRIKSTFYKLMDEQYAQHYIITGKKHGSAFKYIPIIKPDDSSVKEDIENRMY